MTVIAGFGGITICPVSYSSQRPIGRATSPPNWGFQSLRQAQVFPRACRRSDPHGVEVVYERDEAVHGPKVLALHRKDELVELTVLEALIDEHLVRQSLGTDAVLIGCRYQRWVFCRLVIIVPVSVAPSAISPVFRSMISALMFSLKPLKVSIGIVDFIEPCDDQDLLCRSRQHCAPGFPSKQRPS